MRLLIVRTSRHAHPPKANRPADTRAVTMSVKIHATTVLKNSIQFAPMRTPSNMPTPTSAPTCSTTSSPSPQQMINPQQNVKSAMTCAKTYVQPGSARPKRSAPCLPACPKPRLKRNPYKKTLDSQSLQHRVLYWWPRPIDWSTVRFEHKDLCLNTQCCVSLRQEARKQMQRTRRMQCPFQLHSHG
jgi:hypothetical protein